MQLGIMIIYGLAVAGVKRVQKWSFQLGRQLSHLLHSVIQQSRPHRAIVEPQPPRLNTRCSKISDLVDLVQSCA